MKSFSSHLAIGAACLTAGGLAAAAITAPTHSDNASEAAAAVPVPEQVRTETVTSVIHRVRRIHLHPKRRAAASSPPPAPAIPPASRVRTAAPASIPVAPGAPAPSSRPTIHTRTSGSAGQRDHGHATESDHGEYEGGDD